MELSAFQFCMNPARISTDTKPEERWLPVHTVETIMLSVISMLSSPNSDSPANLEAAKEYREQPDVFKKKIQKLSVLVKRTCNACIIQ